VIVPEPVSSLSLQLMVQSRLSDVTPTSVSLKVAGVPDVPRRVTTVPGWAGSHVSIVKLKVAEPSSLHEPELCPTPCHANAGAARNTVSPMATASAVKTFLMVAPSEAR
jgi:hypothetical protein